MEPSLAMNRRLIVGQALRTLITASQSERARLPADAAERQFYLGVEAAAHDALYPDRASAKAIDWLDRESAAFRNGFTRAAIAIANAMSTATAPLVLPLPRPDGTG